MGDSGSVMEKQKAIARYLEAIRLFEENDFIVETEYFCNRILDIDSSNVEAKRYLEQIQSEKKSATRRLLKHLVSNCPTSAEKLLDFTAEVEQLLSCVFSIPPARILHRTLRI